MKKIYLILTIVFISFYSYGQINTSLQFSNNDFNLTSTGQFTDIQTITPPHSTNNLVSKKIKIGYTETPGNPRLPVFTQYFLLPSGSNFSNLIVSKSQKYTYTGSFVIAPSQPNCPVGYPCDSIGPNPTIYNSTNPYPQKNIKLVADYYIADYHIVGIQICPFEYIPATRQLNLYKQINFTIQYNNGNYTYKGKTNQKIAEINTNIVKSIVSNEEAITTAKRPVANLQPVYNPLLTRKLVLKWRPSDIGDAPEFIIITNQQLKPYFEFFASYKTQKGIPTKVVTVEQIVQNYSGIDTQEKIRNYLKDVYNHWNKIYILLGGDNDIIPVRIGTRESYITTDYYRATDFYYSDVYEYNNPNYNWNSSGNSNIGTDDSLELVPDNFLGRAPVNISNVNNFINKIISYETVNNNVDIQYFKNILLLGAYFHHYYLPVGQNIQTTIYNKNYLNNYNKYRLYDDYYGDPNNTQQVGNNTYPGDEELRRQSVLSKMNFGDINISGKYFHIISHFDHGNPYSIGTSVMSKGEAIYNNDVNIFQNNYYQILFSVACEPGEINKDCFAKHYVNADNSGGVAIIANSGFGWTGYSSTLTNNFFDGIYDTQDGNILGVSFQNSLQYFYGNGSLYSDIKKWTIKNQTLYGDPTMRVWTDVPQTITLTAPPTFAFNPLTTNDYTVSINPINQDATITLFKQNGTDVEVYANQIIPAGQTNATFNLHPSTPGQLTVTATARNYIPDIKNTIISFINNSANLYITNVDYEDNSGNGNGNIESGESIGLTIHLRNAGNTDISDIHTTLSVDNALSNTVILEQTQVDYAQSVNAGNSIGLTGYRFRTQGELPPYLRFKLNITANNNYQNTDIFYLDTKTNKLILGSRKILDDNDNFTEAPQMNIGQEYNFFVNLSNNGDVEESGITAILSSTSSDIEIIQNQSDYNTIPVNDQKTNNVAYRIKLINTPTNNSVPLKLSVTNSLGQITEFDFDLYDQYPDLISGYHFESTDQSITLYWNPDISNKGYNVYRSNDINGNFVKINDHFLTSSRFTDTNVNPTTEYYYKISIVTPTNNELPLDLLLTNTDYNNGIQLNAYKAWTILPYQTGFPTESHINSGRNNIGTTAIDVNGNGYKEIFYNTRDFRNSAEKGITYAFDYQGQELFNIDNNATTKIGYFDENDESLRTRVSIADLDLDGNAEVVITNRHVVSQDPLSSKIKIFKSVDETNDNYDRPDKFWNTDVTTYSINMPTVLADINNDGFKDIITIQENQKVVVYDKDQQVILTCDLSNSVPLSEGNLAVADIDNDGTKEIVFGIKNNTNNKGAIYYCKYDVNHPNNVNVTPVLIKEFTGLKADHKLVLGDIDGDGNFEIIAVTHDASNNYLNALNIDGSEVFSPIQMPNISGIALGDLNNDNIPEIVVAADDLHVVDNNGNDTTITTPDRCYGSPIIADVDSDNDQEIIVAGGEFMLAYNLDGTLCPGWKMPPLSSFSFNSTPSVADIDNDGINEIIADDNNANIYTWKTTGSPNHIEWGSERYNAQNTAAYQPATNLDLMIKDSSIDTGIEPDANTPRMWESEDIWVRNNDDGGMEHENPEYVPNQPVYVYVRVTNRSDVASHLGDNQLKLYWAKASTSLGWPAPWDGTQTNNNNAVMGGTIDTKDIPILQPGESRVIKFTWHIPDPSNYQEDQNTTNHWHFCLLGEITSSVDNLTSPLTNDLHTNVRNNNNLAWKNLTVLDLEPNSNSNTFTATVGVGNPYNTSHAFYLELKKDASEAGKAIYEEAEVKLKMDDVLYEAWERGGKVAQETEDTEDVKKKKVKDNNVILDNIYFLPNEQGKLTLSFNFLTKELTNKEKYHYYLIQHDATTGKVIGGETYLIKKKPRPIFHAEANDLQVDKGEQVSLNANDINETAEYNWYDQEGNLIYSGKDMDIVAAMEKKYKLEVIADIDGFKDYKDVDVKFKPDRITSIYPNPASDNMEIEYKINKSSSAYIMIVGITNPNFVNNYVIDVNQSSYTINVHNFPTGEYSIVLIGDGEIKDVQSVIKE